MNKDAQPINSEEARELACDRCGRCLSDEQCERQSKYLQRQLDTCQEERARDVWVTEISKLNAWRASEAFKHGEYAQGIDQLMLELIEFRSLMYAFQQVSTKFNPFSEHPFFMQWWLGATYVVMANFGKLANAHRWDNSLTRLWELVSPFIRQDKACAAAELDYIDRQLQGKKPQFNENSRAFQFRNTSIAHNEKNIPLQWDEVDAELHFLVRVWSVVVAWSSWGLYDPFRTADQAFSGLEPYFEPHDMKALKSKRGEYLTRVTQWSVNHLHTGVRDPALGVFRQLVVKSEVVAPTPRRGVQRDKGPESS